MLGRADHDGLDQNPFAQGQSNAVCLPPPMPSAPMRPHRTRGRAAEGVGHFTPN